MIRRFSGETADQLWQQISESYRQNNGWQSQESRVGKTSEMLHVALSIDNPTQRWVVSRAPALNPGFALAEVVWILAGRNDSRFINAFFPSLPKFQGGGPVYHGAYGYRLRHQFGIDQLERAYCALSNNPETRQIILQVWDPNVDFPDERGQPRSKDIPCNVIAMLKVRDGALDWMQIMRSNDVWRGLPHNIVQFTSLQEILAGWLGLNVGTYNHISDSLHIYEDETSNFVKQSFPIDVQPNTDSLALGKSESDALFKQLASRVDMMIHDDLMPDKLSHLTHWETAPKSIQNMLHVMAAEIARRHNWLELSQQIISRCENPCYIQLWERWFERNHPL